MTIITHLINGEMRPANGRVTEVFNPATGEAIRQVELAGKATVEEAIVLFN